MIGYKICLAALRHFYFTLIIPSNYSANIKEMYPCLLDTSDDRRILADEMHYMPMNGFCIFRFFGFIVEDEQVSNTRSETFHPD